MGELEIRLQQASKLQDLFLAISEELKDLAVGVVYLDEVGSRCRAEIHQKSAKFIDRFSAMDIDVLKASASMHQEILENVIIGERIWKIFPLVKIEGHTEFLFVDGGGFNYQVINRFAHEWRWFRRLERAEDQLLKDDLTGLFNTRYLEMTMDQELLRCQRFNLPFSVVFIDLDNFKSVNDRFGHLVGSALLKAVGQSLVGAVREVDSVVRYGGDEFVGILLGANQSKAIQVGERIRKSIASTSVLAGYERVVVTASIGIASFPENGSTREALLGAADQSMYQGKNQGKNRVMRPALEPFRGSSHG